MPKNSIFWVNALPLMNIDTFIRITKLIKVLIFLGLQFKKPTAFSNSGRFYSLIF